MKTNIYFYRISSNFFKKNENFFRQIVEKITNFMFNNLSFLNRAFYEIM